MNQLSGTTAAIRLILRRDRIALPVWVLVLTGFVLGTASTLASSYATPAARAAFADSIQGNPAVGAIYGHLLGDSVGALTAWRVSVSGALFFGIFSIVTVLRHTRGEEETGRAELLRSGVVGRLAPLAAALAVTIGAHLFVGLLVGAGLVAQGQPAGGSFALAATLAATGAVLAGVAALAAQFSTGVRAATGIAAAVFLLMVGLRMLGDAAGAGTRQSPLLWLSPLGWSELVRPFTGDRWPVLLLPLALAVLLAAVAFVVCARRDIGAGVLAARPGPANAAPGLAGPLALAWRLQRGSLLAVVLGSALLGLLLGSLASSIGGVLGAGSGFAEMLDRLDAANAGEALLGLLLYALAEAIAFYAIIIALRPHAEETAGTAAPLLVAGVSRTRWLASHLVLAAIAPALCLLALGATAGLGYGFATGDLGVVLPTIGTTLARLPAVWVLAAVAIALFGLLPRLAVALSWAVFGLVLVLELAWELGALDTAVFAISPFAHVHPSDPITVTALLGLTGIALLLTAAGVAGLRRRDLT